MSWNDFAAVISALLGAGALGKGVAWLVDRLRDRSAATITQLRAENKQLRHDLSECKQMRRIAELP